MQKVLALLPGMALCVGFAAIAMLLAGTSLFHDQLHIGPLLLVILIGMLFRTAFRLPEILTVGIGLAQKPVLRWAVAGLGFKLSLAELGSIGGGALAVVLVSTFVSLFVGVWVSRKLGVSEPLSWLMSFGGSICGASAIVAADSVIQSKKSESACSLGTITLLGTLGILIYPVLGRLMHLPDFTFGVWSGASLHEIAQVVAAGDSYSSAASEVATVSKLARVALLAPTILWLVWHWRKKYGSAGQAKIQVVPWFLIVFVAIVSLNSLVTVPSASLEMFQKIDLWLLSIGMAGVGLNSGFQDVKAAGINPVIGGLVQWIVLAAVSLGLAVVVGVPGA